MLGATVRSELTHHMTRFECNILCIWIFHLHRWQIRISPLLCWIQINTDQVPGIWFHWTRLNNCPNTEQSWYDFYWIQICVSGAAAWTSIRLLWGVASWACGEEWFWAPMLMWQSDYNTDLELTNATIVCVLLVLLDLLYARFALVFL